MANAQILRGWVQRVRGPLSGALFLAALSFVGLSAVACGGAVDFRDNPQRVHPGSLLSNLEVSTLAPEQQRALQRGELVTVPMVHERGGRRYTGGASHLVIQAPASGVMEALMAPGGLAHVLPRTKRAALVGEGEGWRQVELLQGNRWVEATYTVTLWDQPGAQTGAHRVLFALDRTRPHDVDDLRGFFVVAPLGERRCVVSVAAFVDLGSSLAVLFEGRIQDLVLTAPLHLRHHMESVRVAQAD